MSPLIDVHVHLTPPEIAADRAKYLAGEGAWTELYRDPKARMVSTGELLAMMDEEGVGRALVMGFPWSNEETAVFHNKWLLDQADLYPDRLLPLAAFDALAPWAYAHAEAMLEAGHLGLGELAFYDRGFGPAELDVLEGLAGLCRDRGRVFLMHVNEPIGHKYPGKAPLELGEIYELVLRCRGVKLILAHFGGGLPLLAALKKEVKDALENVRFDLAAMPYLFDPCSLKMALEVLPAGHFFLGTDFPLLKPTRYRKYLNDAGLDAETQNLMLGGAAAAFLGLK